MGALFGGGDRQDGVGEHDQDRPAMPGGPGSYLVLVQPGQAFAGLERFLDSPPAAGDLHQHSQRDRGGAVAAVNASSPVVSLWRTSTEHCPVLPGSSVVVCHAHEYTRAPLVPARPRVAATNWSVSRPLTALRSSGRRRWAPCGWWPDQHVADRAFVQQCAQFGAGTVHLVTGDPRAPNAGVEGVGDHVGSELGIGGEPDLSGYPSLIEAVPVISPTRRQIQAPIDQGVTFVAGVASAFHADCVS